MITQTDTMVIQEVSPRDGLQIESKWVETADKVRLIDDLSAVGFQRIEVSSFVSPRAVPALADAAKVFAAIKRRLGTIYVALVPNLMGAQRALAADADELNFVMSASETHNLANMGMPRDGSLRALAETIALARSSSVEVNATVATAFGCPFEGDQPVSKVCAIVDRYLASGAAGVTLADTTGMANPVRVAHLVKEVLKRVSPEQLTLHFHDTRGLGLINVMAAYHAGARRFDSSLGGLGGCPFAPGASGNVTTEDLVNLCHETGIATGLNLRALLALSRTLPALVGHEVPGQVAKAGLVSDLHPAPASLRRTG
ncbi:MULTISPECIES: hydroxymethylglutaryl-CoA lyase [unclassified Sinorhizobium]|uniref:hydroxymethylglutaryl-CoA lyase n=1 Tax=unclassified Sinorhizobium TaxID=2613772 RepID=UPI0035246E7D